MPNSTNATLSAITSLNAKSMDTLAANLPASVMMLVFGSVGSFVNVVTVLVICRCSVLRTKCYFLIANLCVGDFILSGSFCATGIKRLIRLCLNIPETATQVMCLVEMILPFFGQELSQNLAVAICIDRILAIFIPNWYRSAPKLYTASIATVAWVYSLVVAGFAFYNTSSVNLVANCVLSTITPDVFYNFQNSMNIVVSTITMAGYIVVLAQMRLKYKPKTDAPQKLKHQMENKITLTLGVVVLVSFVTHVVWSIAFAAIANLDPKTKNVVGPLLRNLPIFNSVANPLIYFWRSSEFRAGVLATFHIKSTKVSPANASIMSTKTIQSTAIRRVSAM